MVKYTYDTWGKLLSITGDLKDTLGVKNPYRYRGYRYDSETSLYYLNFRYYNPEWGRFINSDSYLGEVGSLLSCNTFAYCENNPINLYDPSGKFAIALPLGISIIVKAVMATAVIVLTAYAVYNVVSNVVSNTISKSKNDTKALPKVEPKVTDSAKNEGAGEASPTVDTNTGEEVGRFVADDKGNVMIEPKGGKTVKAGKGGMDTHTLYPNGSNYQRYNPKGHPPKSTNPHGHGHLKGTGPGIKGQGPSIDVNGNVVPWNSPGAHWPIR